MRTLGMPVGGGSGERYRLGLDHFAARVLEPAIELDEGVRVSGGNVEGNPPLAHETSANCQFGRAERLSGLDPFFLSR